MVGWLIQHSKDEETSKSKKMSTFSHQETYTYPNLAPKLLEDSNTKLLNEEALICPITCATLPASIDVCVYGQGPYIMSSPLFHDVDSDENKNRTTEKKSSRDRIRGFKFKLFENDEGSLHGLRFLSLSDMKSIEVHHKLSNMDLGLAFGGRHVAFFRTDYKSSIRAISIKTKNVMQSSLSATMQCSDWIWDAKMIPNYTLDSFSQREKFEKSHFQDNDGAQKKSVESFSLKVAIAFMNNSCELWNFDASIENSIEILYPQRLKKITCETRCITYSMSFFIMNTEDDLDDNGDLMVASGTVFNEILVWSVYSPRDKCVTGDRQQETKVLHKLKGHEGVIFKIRHHQTSNGEQLIASTSDDRTVRLWERINISGSSTSNQPNAYQYIQKWIGWGHTARVWDVVFTPYGIMSSGEDGTARLWDYVLGHQLMELKGHACQSIWGVAIDPSGQVAVTMGNDASIKVWNLESHLVLNGIGSLEDVSTQIKNRYTLPKDEDLVPDLILFEKEKKKLEEKHEKSQRNSNKPNTEKKKNASSIKSHKQIIAGMSFFPSRECMEACHKKVLFATRAGSLFSFDLNSRQWKTHKPWYSDDISNILYMPPTSRPKGIPTASCLAIHPNGKFVAIGTTGKNIVLAAISTPSLLGEVDGQSPNCILFDSPHSYYSIQKLTWLTENLLLAFHIKGNLILWEFCTSIESTALKDVKPPRTKMLLHMDTSNSVPMSFYYDQTHSRLIVGDSRGNLAVFNLSCFEDSKNEKLDEQKPMFQVTGAHKKEHITSVLYDHLNDVILSVGNDGILHEWKLPKDISQSDGIEIRHKRLSLPISSLTALTNIWLVQHEHCQQSIVVGGYFGHKYILFDVNRKYMILQVETGGRQRIHDFDIDFKNFGYHFPYKHAFVFCAARKDKLNEIHVHEHAFPLCCKVPKSINSVSTENVNARSKSNTLNYSIGNSFHGETINDACFCETSVPGRSLLLSGSNDCTVRVSIYENSALTCVKDLPPHESCVRAVTCSRHHGAKSSLLVTCGGKLSMSFYLLEDQESLGYENDTNISVYFLCSNRHILSKLSKTIDHRINTVKAVPLIRCPGIHLVFSGDSDGTFQMIAIKDDINDKNRILLSHAFTSNSRPILSLDIVESDKGILVFIGNSAGEICVWDIPSLTKENLMNLRIIYPKRPILAYNAHQMGTNSVCARILPCTFDCIDDSDLINIIVCSGGDDQGITSAILSCDWSRSKGHFLLEIMKLERLNEASSSAIKSLKITSFQDKSLRLYVVGYDQRLALWKIGINHRNNKIRVLTFLSSSYAHIADISKLDCITMTEANGSNKEVCVVVGEGAQVFSVDPNIHLAAEYLVETNFMLITAGAGASCDSGLVTYDSMPEEYREMCNPITFIDDREKFQKFWLDFARLYSKTIPHDGYSILDQWCSGRRLKNLKRDIDLDKQYNYHDLNSPWWIYTSNVDGLFRRFNGFHNTLCEIHGVANEFRCAQEIGFCDGIERDGPKWKTWNDLSQKVKTSQCKASIFAVKEDTDPGNLLCEFCLLPARPNVLMFHDSDTNILESINSQREKYQAWEERIENEVVLKGEKLVILEIGCGIAVPAVRQESDEVLLDCLSRLRSDKKETRSNKNAILIRINPKNAEASTDNNVVKACTISIFDDSLKALQDIDDWVKALSG